jgi:hypothetical protein
MVVTSTTILAAGWKVWNAFFSLLVLFGLGVSEIVGCG